MPIPFLRNVSLLCERKFVLPGDFVVKKFGLKDRMMYIVSGNVYVLSEEDNDTPILSFSGGTILGETALFTSYRSGVSVLAYTPCELHVLERNKFARVIVPLYPKIYEEMIATMNSRLENAKFMKNIGVYLKKNENIFNNDRNTDVAWLKSVLGVLQGAVRPDGKSEDVESRMKLMEKVYDTVDIRYTFRYLDTLNIALTTDAVFLRSSKCPWILKPDSPVLLIWDTIVLVCTIILSYILTVSLTFPEYETDSIYAWTRFLGLVATADFWVTVCTAIQKNDRIIIIKVSQILKIRLHHLSFWLDIMAAVPWVFLISAQYGSLRLLRLSRMLKLYKLELMFDRIENTHRISMTSLRTIKYGLYITLIGFFLTAIAIIMSCSSETGRTTCPPTSWISIALADHEKLKDKIFRYPLLVVYQTILGIGTPIGRPSDPTECAYWTFMMTVGALLYVFNVSSLSSVKVLSQVILAKQFHLRQAIQYHLNQTVIPDVLKKRVDSYLDTERCYDKGYRISTNEDVLATLPSEVSAKWKYERFGSLLSSVPLFMETSTEFIKEICYIATVGILPPKELLSYGGRHCTEMYVIEKGYCEMIHMEASIPHRTVGAGTAIYPVEMCLQLPVVHTVVTSTYLSFVTINRSDFLRVYSNYPEEKFEFDQLLSEFLKMEQVVELHEVVKEKPEFIDALDAVRPPIPSFTFFEYTINKEDPEYYVINEPFERLKNFKFIKWFLLRLTLRPDGTFIKFYEAQRCFFAIMAVIFYTTRIVMEAGDFTTLVSKIITFLNATAVLDIYVRMHVGYFNDKGLLITHPLATAIHYMKTSMILDVLGILPFEAMVPHATGNTEVLFYSYLTRIIQLHRFLGATSYLQESDSWTSVIKYGKFIPVLLVVAHVFACVVLYESCTFDGSYKENEQFGAGIRCPQDRSFIKSSDNYKLTVWIVYRRSLYIAVSTFTRVGVDEMQIKTISGMNIFSLMSAVTFMVLLLITAQMIADSAIRDGELTAYQDRMTTMVKFMHDKRISPELYKEVVYYFELIWKHRRGQSVDRLIKTFHSALREDVLCALFSKSLSKCPGFVNAGETFYRYLLMHMHSVRFFPNGAVIVHYNDVLDFVDLIHTGSAEVVAPDGSYVTTLGPGSIFGNLIGTTTVRMPVSMVVNAHMEALVFEAPQFFRALSIHRKARQIFLTAIELNSDYLPGITGDHEVYVTNEDDSSSASSGEVSQGRTIFRVFKFLSMRVVDPNWMLIKLWDRNSLFVSCYFSPCAIIYQNAYGDFHRNWILIQYVTDFLFLTMMYLRVHSAFEDVHGNVVRDKRRIWSRFLKSRMGFYAHLASVVPIELIAIVFRGKTMRKMYCLLRLNRTLRIAVVADFFNVQCKKLNINIFKMRLAYLVLLLFFILHVASCILVTMTVKIDPYDFDDLSRRKAYFKNAFHVASLYGGSITRRLPMESSGIHVAYILALEIMMFVTYALIVGDMCAMIDVRHYVMVTYERVIRQFKSYMETCDLTYVLRKNLWNYGCNLWEFNRGRQIPHLVLEAPNYLRREVKNALFVHHLENHDIFSGCHEDFLRQVCDAFVLINFFPDDLIVNVGDINGNMYFIHTGRVLTIHYYRDNLSKEKGREIYEEGRTFGFPSG
ncbi:uncharacterized protein LOC105691064 [Athalia rosae]|uniref:uncharacterized protein LOC105691064 n=1 Tax=Athalia rosae TaxID=37344 RepID=UPI0020338FB1|nr:uncharacterized protein LOC105691064 [Athalia rosae]